MRPSIFALKQILQRIWKPLPLKKILGNSLLRLATLRARGMSELARKVGITREALYRSLSAEGNSELSTLTKALRALGMRLTIQPTGT